MAKKFLRDFEVGATAEQYVAWLLQRAGYSVARSTGRDSDKDLCVSRGGLSCTIEVKFDRMSGATGNLAIEFWNPRSDLPSGITATRADYWVYVLEKPLVAYLVSVRSLVDFMAATQPLKSVRYAGDGNASIHLYKLESLFPILGTLSETHPDAIHELFC